MVIRIPVQFAPIYAKFNAFQQHRMKKVVLFSPVDRAVVERFGHCVGRDHGQIGGQKFVEYLHLLISAFVWAFLAIFAMVARLAPVAA